MPTRRRNAPAWTQGRGEPRHGRRVSTVSSSIEMCIRDRFQDLASLLQVLHPDPVAVQLLGLQHMSCLLYTSKVFRQDDLSSSIQYIVAQVSNPGIVSKVFLCHWVYCAQSSSSCSLVWAGKFGANEGIVIQFTRYTCAVILYVFYMFTLLLSHCIPVSYTHLY